MPDVPEQHSRRTGTAESYATGQALLNAGLITPQQYDVSMRQRAQAMDDGRIVFLEQVLVANKFVTKEQISAIVNREVAGGGQSGLFQTLLPVETCRRYQIFPVRLIDGKLEIKVCTALKPSHLVAIQAACSADISGLRVIPTDRVEIRQMLSRVISHEHSLDAMLAYMRDSVINGAMVRQAIQAMLIESIERRASDIHIDNKPDPDAWISHRVDGSIQQSHLVPEKVMKALFMSLKNDAGMDGSDQRRAQDGRITVQMEGRQIDFRVATQPVTDGETMTMRVLDPEKLLSIDDLFPNQPDMELLFHRIAKVNGKNGGLVLFSGPTGSGKTTSMNALIQLFPRDEMNIITVENPVEYKMPFVRQIQLNDLMAEEATDVEKSLLRQDPDVLIMGEIRDLKTLKAALKFAESGHLAMASIHANNSEETFMRVLSFADGENKTEALYLLARTLRVVVNQRLVKQLCSCAVPDPEAGQAYTRARNAGIPVTTDTRFKKAVGCPRCKGRGYRERVAAHETMILSGDEKVRNEITAILFAETQNLSAIKDVDGITYKSRRDTLGRLLDVGLIDVETAESSTSARLN
jgi:type II secretory ATPase GspE/PulE/Tfp pilus assembly ATPase PilB-like protein